MKNVLDSFTVKLPIKNLKKKLFPHNIIIPFLCGAVKFVFLPATNQKCMDKKIWLRVIREELELLDTLATGMIDDKHLSKEEVELAIARSKIVAKEFEMLLNQIAAPVHQEEKVAEVEIPAKTAEEGITFQMPVPEYNIAEFEPELPSEESIDEPLIQIEESPVPQSPGPLVSQSPSPPVPHSPGLSVTE
ncbi:MAG: hypothetical protein AAB347_08540, partial [Bacteroidota bacterium]